MTLKDKKTIQDLSDLKNLLERLRTDGQYKRYIGPLAMAIAAYAELMAGAVQDAWQTPCTSNLADNEVYDTLCHMLEYIQANSQSAKYGPALAQAMAVYANHARRRRALQPAAEPASNGDGQENVCL